MKKTRNSNFEVVRIMSMYLIVLGHFYWETNWDFTKTNILLRTGIQHLWFGGKLGVDLFVLISAFFLFSRKEIKYVSLIKLWGQVLFYSVGISIFVKLFMNMNVGWKELVKSFIPISTGMYWFVTAYVVMYLLAPYINIFLDSLSKKEFQFLLLLLLFIYFFGTTFQNQAIGFKFDEASTIIGVYPFGCYIRKYKKDIEKISFLKLLITAMTMNIILFFSAFCINYVNYLNKTIQANDHSFDRFYGAASPFQIICSICILCIFVKMKPHYIKSVNLFSKSVFGVYLFHCQPLLINFIWNDVVKGFKYETTPFVFFYAAYSSFVIFLIGLIFDLFRQLLLSSVKLFSELRH